MGYSGDVGLLTVIMVVMMLMISGLGIVRVAEYAMYC